VLERTINKELLKLVLLLLPEAQEKIPAWNAVGYTRARSHGEWWAATNSPESISSKTAGYRFHSLTTQNAGRFRALERSVTSVDSSPEVSPITSSHLHLPAMRFFC